MYHRIMRFPCILTVASIGLLAACTPFMRPQPPNDVQPVVSGGRGEVVPSEPPAYSEEDFEGGRTTLEHGVAYGKLDGLETAAILERDGEIFVMQTLAVEPNHAFWRYVFRDFRESPSGRYVFFEALGWEWADFYVYDTDERLIIVKMSDPQAWGITEDERRLFECQSAGMSSNAHGSVYSLPEGTPLVTIDQDDIDLAQDSYLDTVECTRNGNSVTFVVTEYSTGEHPGTTVSHTFVVDLETGAVTKK